MQKDSPENIAGENRVEPRSTGLRAYRVEIKFIGKPIYQFKVRDVCPGGAGILIKSDSDFLNMIAVGQIFDVKFISPKDSNPSGMHKAELKHITRLEDGRYKGHSLVGIATLERLNQP